MPRDPKRATAKSVFQWTSVGRLRINLQKLETPDRWPSIVRDDTSASTQGESKVWWDVHEKFRGELVRFKQLPEDKEQSADILDEIAEEKERK